MTWSQRLRRASSAVGIGMIAVVGALCIPTAAAAAGSGAVSIGPSLVDFGDVAYGESATREVVVTNIGSAELLVDEAAGGAAPGVQSLSNCAFARLQPGESCRMTYTWRPWYSGPFSTATNGTIEGVPFALTLVGNGIGGPTRPSPVPLDIGPTSHDFGDVAFGTTSATFEMHVTNVWSHPVVVTGAGGAAPGVQSFQDCEGRWLEPGESCHYFYAWSPAFSGPFTTTTSGTVLGVAFTLRLTGNGLGGPPPPPPPVTPTFTAPTTGSIVGSSVVHLQGTGRPGALVFVGKQAGVALGSSPVAANGTWAIDLTLPDGLHTVGGLQFFGATQTPLTAITFTVDTVAPVFPVLEDVVVEASGPSGASVSYPPASAIDAVDGPMVGTCSPASGSLFALGTATVLCTATDRAGHVATASRTIRVVDTTGPTLTVPPAMTVDATGADGARISYSTSAVDLVDGVVPVVCTPASGAVVAVGDSVVTCDAVDAHGNRGQATFALHVRGADEQLEDIIDDAAAIGDASLRAKLDSVASALDRGNAKAAANQLDAALKYVAAQTGKKLTAAEATQLTADLTRLRRILEGRPA